MTEITLPKNCLTFYFVRHGERIDHIDDTWIEKAETPFDPPLTREGWSQAERTGQFIYQEEEDPSNTEYLVLTSPFLRCVQTAEGICKGYGGKTSNWQIAVEPGLSEVMNETYFSEPISNDMIKKCGDEIRNGQLCSNMDFDEQRKPAKDIFSDYPENYQSMLARFTSTLDWAATEQLHKMSVEQFGSGKNTLNKKQVVIFVTHGGGIASLVWATSRQLGINNVPYCCLTRAVPTKRNSSLPLPAFGQSRVSAYSWDVDYKVFAGHIV